MRNPTIDHVREGDILIDHTQGDRLTVMTWTPARVVCRAPTGAWVSFGGDRPFGTEIELVRGCRRRACACIGAALAGCYCKCHDSAVVAS